MVRKERRGEKSLNFSLGAKRAHKNVHECRCRNSTGKKDWEATRRKEKKPGSTTEKNFLSPPCKKNPVRMEPTSFRIPGGGGPSTEEEEKGKQKGCTDLWDKGQFFFQT